MDERDPLTALVIGAAIEVHRELGPGLLESVYQKCMEIELRLQGQAFLPQAPLPLVYKGHHLGEDDFRMDLYFPGKLVVELKAVEKILPIHEAQLNLFETEQDACGPAAQLLRPRPQKWDQTHGRLTLSSLCLCLLCVSVSLWFKTSF
jgi:GxxExxY protein